MTDSDLQTDESSRKKILKHPYHKWSQQDDEILRKMYPDPNISMAEISATLKVSPNNIYVRARRMSLIRPRGMVEERKQLINDIKTKQQKLIKGGLAKRMALQQNIKIELDAIEPAVPDEMINEFIKNPEEFFKYLNVTLFDYQKEGLNLILQNQRVALVWGRQCGKDTLLALYALWMALITPKSIVVCVSPSQRQSDLWMNTLQSFALSKREIRDSITDMSKSEFTLVNGSKIYSLPGAGTSGSSTIRGFSKVSLLLINEAAFVPEDTFQAAQPFLAVAGRNAKLVLISTPFGQSGYLWRAWNSDVFVKLHANTRDNPLVPQDFLDKEKQTLDSLSYAAEYEAQFLSSQNAYFPTELIQKCVEAYTLVETPLPEFHYDYYLGCDWARIAGADKTVLTVMGIDHDGKGKVIWIRSFDGVDYVTQANEVMYLDGHFHFKKIYSDASNHAINDLLVSKGLPVEPIQFSMVGKQELFGRLRNAMEAGRVTIPQHKELLRELSTFEYKITEAGNLLLHHVEGGHDDYPDSLALAALEVTTERILLKAVDAVATANAIIKLSTAYDNLKSINQSGVRTDQWCSKCQKFIDTGKSHRHDENGALIE